MTDPIKNPTTYEQQLAKLKSRGCTTKDDTFCIAVLKTVNYYRLSAYFLPFKNSDDTMAKVRVLSRVLIFMNSTGNCVV